MSMDTIGKVKRQGVLMVLLVAIGALIWGCNCSRQIEGDEVSGVVAEAAEAPQVEVAAEPQQVEAEVKAEPVETNITVEAVQEVQPAAVAAPTPPRYYGKIGIRLAGMLPKYHVLQQKLDDTISQRAWTNIVTFYDADHSIFLKSDLDELAVHEFRIDDELKAGDISFGFDLYNLFVERFRERIDFATNLLAKGEWDFSESETYCIKRKDAPWPETREEAEDLWRRRMKNEVLVQIIARELDAEKAAAKKSAGEEAEDNGDPAEKEDEDDAKKRTPEENLIKKYRQYATVMLEPDEEAILQNYLDCVARAYDPHTDYMSPASKEDFDMDMNLMLCGVGAVLGFDDGALKIDDIMPGGPIDLDGRIKRGDKIVGVKQGDGEMEDILWQPMKKSIKKIRGPKGSRVTLEIIPRSDPSGATRKLIELVRDEINLEDQAATGRVERVTLDGVERKLGYIFLPSFYESMDKQFGDPSFRSCAMDVNRYIADFNAEGVEGLVLDLRGNGGGSLREAVMLSSLFVSSGPVVQIRDTRTVVTLPIPPGNPVAFRKPIVVLIDRASASASEIVAGHLQDVGRAIVIGDSRTHGKGTVQSVLGMGPDKYGSTKITTARFYRINGRSTQIEGVESDILLPSLLDSLDIGEDKLPNALPFTRILPADYAPSWNLGTYVGELKARSDARLSGNARYVKHMENVNGMRALSEREIVSLERTERTAMMRADRELREFGEENDEEKEESVSRRHRNRGKKDDVVLDESFLILSDLVRMTDGAELPVKIWL